MRTGQPLTDTRSPLPKADIHRRPQLALSSWRPEAVVQRFRLATPRADIAGQQPVGYPEDESRLSDITLQWMVEQATGLPHPLQINRARLHIFPDAGGMQHSEVASMKESFSWAGYFLEEELREINVEAVLHPTVMTRFELPGVLHFGLRREYRPTNLSAHTKLGKFFNKKPEVAG